VVRPGPPKVIVAGVTVISDREGDTLQLASGSNRLASTSALREKRSSINDSLLFLMILHLPLYSWPTKKFTGIRNQKSQ
jgi:hypothetical protein